MENDELVAELHNSVEVLSNRIDKLEEVNARTVAALEKNIEALGKLDTTVTQTNKVFDEVSEGIKGLYEKVKQLEIWGKLLGNLGNLAPLLSGLGGLGGLGNPPKPK